jgi:hypothetical protein
MMRKLLIIGGIVGAFYALGLIIMVFAIVHFIFQILVAL